MPDLNKNSLSLPNLEEELEMLLEQNLPPKTDNINHNIRQQQYNEEKHNLAFDQEIELKLNNDLSNKQPFRRNNLNAPQVITTSINDQFIEATYPIIENSTAKAPQYDPEIKEEKFEEFDLSNSENITTAHNEMAAQQSAPDLLKPQSQNSNLQAAEHENVEKETQHKIEDLASIIPAKDLAPQELKHQASEVNYGEENLNFFNNTVHNTAEENIENKISANNKNRIKYSIIGVIIFMILAIIYYIYQSQPFAPSIIYADNSPYKTKNMIEDLESQNIVTLDSLLNKRKAQEQNTEKQLQAVAKDLQNQNNSILANNSSSSENTHNKKTELLPQPPIPNEVKQAIIAKEQKAIEDNKKAKNKVENNTNTKEDNKEAKAQDRETKLQSNQLSKENKEVKKPEASEIKDKAVNKKENDNKIITPETNKIDNFARNTGKLPITNKDIEFSSNVQPEIENMLPIAPQKPIKSTNNVRKSAKTENKNNKINEMSRAYVQLASTPSLSSARALQKNLNTKYSYLLENRIIDIEKSQPINNRIYYRLRIKSTDLEQAKRLCEDIKHAGGECIFGKS